MTQYGTEGAFHVADKFPPWFSQLRPRSLYTSYDAEAFWDVPVISNRVDGRFFITRARKYSWLR